MFTVHNNYLMIIIGITSVLIILSINKYGKKIIGRIKSNKSVKNWIYFERPPSSMAEIYLI